MVSCDSAKNIQESADFILYLAPFPPTMKLKASRGEHVVVIYKGELIKSNSILSAILPFAKLQILDASKLKEFAEDNYFKFDKNGRKFSKILHWSKLRAFADDKINLIENLNLFWKE